METVTPMKECRERPSAMIVTKNPECMNCLIITNYGLTSSGPMTQLVPCELHRK